MLKKLLIVALVLICIYLALQAGFYAGTRKTQKFFVNRNALSATFSLNSRIKALESIKKGEIKKAEEALESSIDEELGYLGVTAQNPLLEDKANMLKTIQNAKSYREKYPGHQIKPPLVNGVTNALKLIEK
jgi:hypothetical protein